MTKNSAIGTECHPDFAHECRIRDYYASKLQDLRPNEKLSKKEVRYLRSPVRADMRTIDNWNVIREWEFKIIADYKSIGQILAYVAQAKLQYGLTRPILPVIAAFTFPAEIVTAVYVNNLGIELVTIPSQFHRAGGIPEFCAPLIQIPLIP
jgi:hypothetical protein